MCRFDPGYGYEKKLKIMINPIKQYYALRDAIFSMRTRVWYIDDYILPLIKRELKIIRVLVLLSICIDVLAVVLWLILR